MSRAARNFHGNGFSARAPMVAEYLQLHPVDPQPRLIRQAAESCAGRPHRLPDRLLLRTRVASGGHGGTRAGAAHPAGGPAPSFHAGVRQPRPGGALRAPGNLAVPHTAHVPARALHIPAAGHARDPAPPAAPEAPHHRRAHPGTPGTAPAAGGAAGAAHELDAARGRRPAAAHGRHARFRRGSSTRSMRSSMVATAGSSRPPWSICRARPR